jgi:DNA-binding HxlR family transcriptional regulator
VRKKLDAAMFDSCGESPVMIRVGDKWTARIMVCLRDGPQRFSQLRVPLHDVTPKVLTESLRAMVRDGLLTRTSYPEMPPRVEYELTALGHSLFKPLEAACEWSRAHGAQVMEARGTNGPCLRLSI